MQRILIRRPGGYDALERVEAPDLEPGPGEVAIAVAAAGVNYADGIVRMGLYASARELHGYPITPGFEVAGRIAAIGPGVAGWQVGERVVALTLFGGYCSRLVLPSERVFRCPDRIALDVAAGIPTVFLTAWYMVHRQLHPRPGEIWLVHSAAGGVGMALAQLGRLAGARVVGVVGRPAKREAALAAGCHAVIDRSAGALWTDARALAPGGYDAVFDANGVATLRQSYDHVAPAGRLLVYGFASMLPRDGRINWLRLVRDWLRTPRFDPLTMTRQNRSVLACNLSYLSARAAELADGMRWLLARFEAGDLEPLPVTRYPLAEAAAAQRAIESGATIGKLVLVTETQ